MRHSRYLYRFALLALYNTPPDGEGGGAAVADPPAPSGDAAATPAAGAAAAETPAGETPPAQTPDEIKAAQVAAIKGVLQVPENASIDPAITDRIAAIASERGLTPEQAAAMFGSLVQEATAHAEKAVAAVQDAHKPGGPEWTKLQEHYRAEALADPALGGGNPEQLEANTHLAKRVVATFGGTPEQIAAIEQSGFMNSPTALRLLVGIGKAMSEDKLVTPGGGAKPAPTEQDALYRLYPSMKPKE